MVSVKSGMYDLYWYDILCEWVTETLVWVSGLRRKQISTKYIKAVTKAVTS